MALVLHGSGWLAGTAMDLPWHALPSQTRAVQAFRGGCPGPVRLLSRSLGMGGTGSPLGWSMSYDPIIWFVGEAVRLRRPTYVDDTAALAVGPHQTFRAQVALRLTGHAVGLRILTHTCQWLEIDNPSDQLLMDLQSLPVDVNVTPSGARVFGLTPLLLANILRAYGWHTLDMRPATDGTARECRCRLKSACVVASQPDAWRTMLADAPFRGTEVKEEWSYLGVTVVGPASLQCPRRWALSLSDGSASAPGREPGHACMTGQRH